jgi:hypothetical protein
MLITLYSAPFIDLKGARCQEKIDIWAKSNFKKYEQYFLRSSPHCKQFCKQAFDNRHDWHEGHTEELVRARRCVAFADAANLTSLEERDFENYTNLDDIRDACNLDHTSVWVSEKETKFLLNEPYSKLEDELGNLTQAGQCFILIPEELSPYGGRWDPTPKIRPWSKSYLICDLKHKMELAEIDAKLKSKAKTTPAWNDLFGLSNVKL